MSAAKRSRIDVPIPYVPTRRANRRKLPRRPEDVLVDEIRLALNEMGVMCLRHVVDNRPRENGAHIRAGLGIGVADLICVVPPYGRFLAIEAKLPGYSPSDVRDAQKRWLTTVALHQGIAGVACSVDEAIALVVRARSSP